MRHTTDRYTDDEMPEIEGSEVPDEDFVPEVEIERLFQRLREIDKRDSVEGYTDEILAQFTLPGLCEHLVRYYPLREAVQALVNVVIVEGVTDPVYINEQIVVNKSEAERRTLSNQASRVKHEAPLWAGAALSLKRVLADLPNVGGRQGGGGD
jgi:hypothetical protein